MNELIKFIGILEEKTIKHKISKLIIIILEMIV